MKVRRIHCTKDLSPYFSKNQILVEYGTYPGFFYPEEEKNPSGVGYCEALLEKKSFLQFFEEIEPIEFKKTKWFKIAEKDLLNEIEIHQFELRILQERMEELLKMKEKFQ